MPKNLSIADPHDYGGMKDSSIVEFLAASCVRSLFHEYVDKLFSLRQANERMLPPAKILIIDDEPLNVDYLQQELKDLGYTTISATNGQEALDKVAAEVPDLILLEVMMPVMDGFTTCRRLKENEATQLIPIIIMTVLRETDDRIRGIEAGVDDFLSKPVDRRELTARIQTAIKMKQVVDRRLSGQKTEDSGQAAREISDEVFRCEGEYLSLIHI